MQLHKKSSCDNCNAPFAGAVHCNLPYARGVSQEWQSRGITTWEGEDHLETILMKLKMAGREPAGICADGDERCFEGAEEQLRRRRGKRSRTCPGS